MNSLSRCRPIHNSWEKKRHLVADVCVIIPKYAIYKLDKIHPEITVRIEEGKDFDNLASPPWQGLTGPITFTFNSHIDKVAILKINVKWSITT